MTFRADGQRAYVSLFGAPGGIAIADVANMAFVSRLPGDWLCFRMRGREVERRAHDLLRLGLHVAPPATTGWAIHGIAVRP